MGEDHWSAVSSFHSRFGVLTAALPLHSRASAPPFTRLTALVGDALAGDDAGSGHAAYACLLRRRRALASAPHGGAANEQSAFDSRGSGRRRRSQGGPPHPLPSPAAGRHMAAAAGGAHAPPTLAPISPAAAGGPQSADFSMRILTGFMRSTAEHVPRVADDLVRLVGDLLAGQQTASLFANSQLGSGDDDDDARATPAAAFLPSTRGGSSAVVPLADWLAKRGEAGLLYGVARVSGSLPILLRAVLVHAERAAAGAQIDESALVRLVSELEAEDVLGNGLSPLVRCPNYGSWSLEQNGQHDVIGLAAHADVVYVSSLSNVVKLDSRTGKVLATAQLSVHRGASSLGLVYVQGYLVMGKAPEAVTILDADTLSVVCARSALPRHSSVMRLVGDGGKQLLIVRRASPDSDEMVVDSMSVEDATKGTFQLLRTVTLAGMTPSTAASAAFYANDAFLIAAMSPKIAASLVSLPSSWSSAVTGCPCRTFRLDTGHIFEDAIFGNSVISLRHPYAAYDGATNNIFCLDASSRRITRCGNVGPRAEEPPVPPPADADEPGVTLLQRLATMLARRARYLASPAVPFCLEKTDETMQLLHVHLKGTNKHLRMMALHLLLVHQSMVRALTPSPDIAAGLASSLADLTADEDEATRTLARAVLVSGIALLFDSPRAIVAFLDERRENRRLCESLITAVAVQADVLDDESLGHLVELITSHSLALDMERLAAAASGTELPADMNCATEAIPACMHAIDMDRHGQTVLRPIIAQGEIFLDSIEQALEAAARDAEAWKRIISVLSMSFLAVTVTTLAPMAQDIKWDADEDDTALLEPTCRLAQLLKRTDSICMTYDAESVDAAHQLADPAHGRHGKVSHTIVKESPHPYEDCMDERDKVTFPGADHLVITFSPQCATEKGHDYLQLFYDEAREHEITCLMSGSFNLGSWPTEPVIVKGDTVHFYFHSDTTNVDWGYKCEISAVMPCATVVVTPLLDMEKSMSAVIGSWTGAIVARARATTTPMYAALCANGLLVAERRDRVPSISSRWCDAVLENPAIFSGPFSSTVKRAAALAAVAMLWHSGVDVFDEEPQSGPHLQTLATEIGLLMRKLTSLLQAMDGELERMAFVGEAMERATFLLKLHPASTVLDRGLLFELTSFVTHTGVPDVDLMLLTQLLQRRTRRVDALATAFAVVSNALTELRVPTVGGDLLRGLPTAPLNLTSYLPGEQAALQPARDALVRSLVEMMDDDEAAYLGLHFPWSATDVDLMRSCDLIPRLAASNGTLAQWTLVYHAAVACALDPTDEGAREFVKDLAKRMVELAMAGDAPSVVTLRVLVDLTAVFPFACHVLGDSVNLALGVAANETCEPRASLLASCFLSNLLETATPTAAPSLPLLTALLSRVTDFLVPVSRPDRVMPLPEPNRTRVSPSTNPACEDELAMATFSCTVLRRMAFEPGAWGQALVTVLTQALDSSDAGLRAGALDVIAGWIPSVLCPGMRVTAPGVGGRQTGTVLSTAEHTVDLVLDGKLDSDAMTVAVKLVRIVPPRHDTEPDAGQLATLQEIMLARALPFVQAPDNVLSMRCMRAVRAIWTPKFAAVLGGAILETAREICPPATRLRDTHATAVRLEQGRRRAFIDSPGGVFVSIGTDGWMTVVAPHVSPTLRVPWADPEAVGALASTFDDDEYFLVVADAKSAQQQDLLDEVPNIVLTRTTSSAHFGKGTRLLGVVSSDSDDGLAVDDVRVPDAPPVFYLRDEVVAVAHLFRTALGYWEPQTTTDHMLLPKVDADSSSGESDLPVVFTSASSMAASLSAASAASAAIEPQLPEPVENLSFRILDQDSGDETQTDMDSLCELLPRLPNAALARLADRAATDVLCHVAQRLAFAVIDAPESDVSLVQTLDVLIAVKASGSQDWLRDVCLPSELGMDEESKNAGDARARALLCRAAVDIADDEQATASVVALFAPTAADTSVAAGFWLVDSLAGAVRVGDDIMRAVAKWAARCRQEALAPRGIALVRRLVQADERSRRLLTVDEPVLGAAFVDAMRTVCAHRTTVPTTTYAQALIELVGALGLRTGVLQVDEITEFFQRIVPTMTHRQGASFPESFLAAAWEDQARVKALQMETAHPYVRMRDTRSIQVAEATSLRIEFDAASELHTGDCVQFTSDESGRKVLACVGGRDIGGKVVRLDVGQCYMQYPVRPGLLFAFGNGSHGKLGHGNEDDCTAPQYVAELVNHTCADVVCGDEFSVALTSSGELYTWGKANYGRLGHGSTAHVTKPKRIDSLLGTTIAQVSAGRYHMTAVTELGAVFSWGDGENGKLGTLSAAPAFVPRLIESLSEFVITHVSCGGEHTLALREDGRVLSWGRGSYGVLGHGDVEDRFAPTVIEGLEDVVAIAAGMLFNLAVTRSGSVYSWGDGDYGVLGHGDEGSLMAPKRIVALDFEGDDKVVGVAAFRSSHACAWTEMGALFTWGKNEHGQLGLVPMESEASEVPASVLLPTRVTALEQESVILAAVGGAHTAVITDSGLVYTWGRAANGRLGHLPHDHGLPSVLPAFERRRNAFRIACGDSHTLLLTHSDSDPNGTQAIHDTVMCDGCQTHPIRGPFFHCVNEANYDLCIDCETSRAFYNTPGLPGSDRFAFYQVRNPSTRYDFPDELPLVGTSGLRKHVGVTCAQCGAVDFEGNRFVCANCPDSFSLCGDCNEDTTIAHDSTHVLIKMRCAVSPEAGDAAVQRPFGPPLPIIYALASYYGFKLDISATYSDAGRRQLIAERGAEFADFIDDNRMFTPELDEELAAVIARMTDSDNFSPMSCASTDFLVPPEEAGARDDDADEEASGPLTAADLLASNGTTTSSLLSISSTTPIVDPLVNTQLAELPRLAVQRRFAVLKVFNGRMAEFLRFVDLTAQDEQSFASAVRDVRGRIFWVAKASLWDTALKSTLLSGGSEATVVLDRYSARESTSEDAQTDANGIHIRPVAPDAVVRTVFGQLYTALAHEPATIYRRDQQAWKVTFSGEKSDDYGGPYRESIAHVCTELQTCQVGVFVLCTNGRLDVGMHGERLVVRNDADVDLCRFVGQLMGLTLRTGDYLALDLAPLVWKQILDRGEVEVSESDLTMIDQPLQQMLDVLREPATAGVDADNFASVLSTTWSVLDSCGVERALRPGGCETLVTWDERLEYADAVVDFRRREAREQIFAIGDGLASVVPRAVLRTMTWLELERCVCGVKKLDVDLLRRKTTVKGIPPNAPLIAHFWSVLTSFSEDEKALFLRFVSGRSRLPARWTRNFVIQPLMLSDARSDPDRFLAHAQTCFFCLELPAYTSAEVMRDRLLYSIHNCVAIDLDEYT